MEIIPRSEWGALVGNLREAGVGEMTKHREGLVSHHMPERATVKGTSKDEEISRIKIVDDYHLNHRRWDGGIGYSWIIANSGRIYEGRGFYVGAHTGGVNSRFFGIGFLANGDKAGITDEAARAYFDLGNHLYKNGWLRIGWENRYHHQFKATSCPGKLLEGKIKDGPLRVDGDDIEDLVHSITRNRWMMRSVVSVNELVAAADNIARLTEPALGSSIEGADKLYRTMQAIMRFYR